LSTGSEDGTDTKTTDFGEILDGTKTNKDSAGNVALLIMMRVMADENS
jgi:hypothetical protein